MNRYKMNEPIKRTYEPKPGETWVIKTPQEQWPDKIILSHSYLSGVLRWAAHGEGTALGLSDTELKSLYEPL